MTQNVLLIDSARCAFPVKQQSLGSCNSFVIGIGDCSDFNQLSSWHAGSDGSLNKTLTYSLLIDSFDSHFMHRLSGFVYPKGNIFLSQLRLGCLCDFS